MSERRAPALAALTALAGVLVLHLARIRSLRGDPSDDAWISFRYARNWLDGYGLVWNPGQTPVEGYSNLAWVLLSALGMEAGLPVADWAVGMGVVFSCLSLWLTAVAVRWLGGGWLAAVGGAGLVAVSAPMAHWATQALETPLYTLLLTAGMALALREHRQAQRGEEPWAVSVVPLSLMAVTRPEGAAFLALPVLLRLLRVRRHPLGRRDVVAGVLLGAPLLLQLVHRLMTFGALVPNTFEAKVHVEDATSEGVRYVLAGLTYDPLLTVVWVGGAALALWHRRGLLLLAPLLAMAIAVVVGGDVFGNQRFLVPVIPLLTATALAGWDAGLHGRPRMRLAMAGFVGLTGLLELTIDEVRPSGHEDWRPAKVRHRPITQLLTAPPVGDSSGKDWMEQLLVESVPPGGTFLFSDVGIIGFAMRDALLLDARGLSWPAALGVIGREGPAGEEGLQTEEARAFRGELHALKPEVLFLQCADGQLFGPPEAILAADPVFQRDYFYFGSGPYFGGIGSSCVYMHRQTQLPAQSTVLERYARIDQEMPGIFDNRARVARLRQGRELPQIPTRGEAPPLPQPGWYDPDTRKAPRRIQGDRTGESAPSGR